MTAQRSKKKGSLDSKVVYSTSIDTLHNEILDFSPYLSDNHFRFIDADAFIQRRTLVIYETSSLPQFYTVISYVWFGLLASPSELAQDGSFRVFCGLHSNGTPLEDGGPISLKVLQYACQWASDSISPYVWLDRLCILQTSRQDKEWQISRMYDIYECSEQCIVLPGGLQRLASVFDETSWADRAWTYQEAIITWEYAVVLMKDWYRSPLWLVDGECQWEHLMQLFLEGDNLLTRSEVGVVKDPGVEYKPCLILGRNGKALNMLGRIIEYKAYNNLTTTKSEETISNQTIRQLVLQGVGMRTSSRPVDMVFSVLGLLDVQDTFQDDILAGSFAEHERFRATLKLVEAVLRLEDDDSNTTLSTLVDVPLWQSLEIVDTVAQSPHDDGLSERNKLGTTMLPTLRELTQLLDSDATELPLSCCPEIIMKRVQSPEWAYEVDQTEDDPSGRASAIAAKISKSDLLNAYPGGEDRIFVHNEEEGLIELCRKLELKPLAEDELGPIVFGWNLKLNSNHPYIRFYKFDISHLLPYHSKPPK